MNPHWLRVFTYELRRGLRRKGFLFTTFLMPLVLGGIGALVVAVTGLNNPEQMMSQNADQINELVDSFTPDAETRYGLIDESGLLADAELPTILTRYDSVETARPDLDGGTIVGYYLIPANYWETGDIRLVMPELMIGSISSGPIEATLRVAIAAQAQAQGVDPTLTGLLQQPARYQITNLGVRNQATIEDGDESFEDANFLIIYVFALIFLLGLFITNGYLLQSVIEEKETRLIEILISSVRPFHLISGKIAAYGLLGLLQIGVWIGYGLLALRVTSGEQFQQAAGVFAALANLQLPLELIPVLLVYFVLGYLMFAGLYGVVGAISNSMREGPQYAVIFTLPAALPLYFLALFATSPDAGLPVFLSLFPLTAPLSMTQRLVISDVPTWQIAVSIGLLLLSVVGTMWLAGRVFRVQTLLAGNAPKLRDLPKLLRG